MFLESSQVKSIVRSCRAMSVHGMLFLYESIAFPLRGTATAGSRGSKFFAGRDEMEPDREPGRLAHVAKSSGQ